MSDKGQKRDVAGILHFLTPQQMAEEIVRLDALLAATRRNELPDFLAWWNSNPMIPPPQDTKAIAWAAWHRRASPASGSAGTDE